MTTSGSRFPRLLDRFDHFDPEFGAHFFEVAGAIREACPVVHSDAYDGFWTFSRFEDVRDGFGNEDRYTAVPTVTIPVNPGAVPIIPLQCDRGIHRDFRRVLDPYFRVSAVAKYEDGIRDVVTELIDSFIEDGRCEFIADFARRVPGRVIFRQFLGLPESEVDLAYEYTLTIIKPGSPEAPQVHQKFITLIERALERRRAEAPRGDVVDALLEGTVDGRPLTEDEIQRTVMMLIAAGLDTTAHALGNMLITLADRPDLRTRLEAEPEALPRAIEELLRWEPPAGGLVRTAIDDVVVGGQQLKTGDRIMLLVAAANRDPDEYDAPEDIDFDREHVRHLAFGYGVHYCLGVHLARLELRVAFEELLARLKDIRIIDPRVKFDAGTSRGPVELNIEFAPGPRSQS